MKPAVQIQPEHTSVPLAATATRNFSPAYRTYVLVAPAAAT